MARERLAPTETTEKGPGGSMTTILRHPAYGSISVSHVTGNANLYGSDFAHQHYVTITISRSELRRDLAASIF